MDLNEKLEQFAKDKEKLLIVSSSSTSKESINKIKDFLIK